MQSIMRSSGWFCWCVYLEASAGTGAWLPGCDIAASVPLCAPLLSGHLFRSTCAGFQPKSLPRRSVSGPWCMKPWKMDNPSMWPTSHPQNKQTRRGKHVSCMQTRQQSASGSCISKRFWGLSHNGNTGEAWGFKKKKKKRERFYSRSKIWSFSIKTS